jgi:hypothetical protein
MIPLQYHQGILPRGLGHPAIFTGDATPGPFGAAVKEIFTTFGAGVCVRTCEHM